MEDRLWEIVVSLFPEDKPSARQTYSDGDILLVVLWAALHDRPIAWACQADCWPAHRQLARLPHPSTVSRRSRTPSFVARLEQAHRQLRERIGPASSTVIVDGKPLRVSDYSRDPDAKNGRAYRRFGKGYKLHAVIDLQGIVLAFDVLPLNVNERRPARQLLTQLPQGVRRVLADGNYDSAFVHQQLEGTGIRFYAPPLNNYAGPRSHRRRRILVRLYQRRVGALLENSREAIERQFGLMGNIGCGLKELPNWVRRQPRVRRWISAKLLMHHAYLLHKRQAT
jgi:Transposase DDE domain